MIGQGEATKVTPPVPIEKTLVGGLVIVTDHRSVVSGFIVPDDTDGQRRTRSLKENLLCSSLPSINPSAIPPPGTDMQARVRQGGSREHCLGR